MKRPVTRCGLSTLSRRVLLALAAFLFLSQAALASRSVPRPSALEPEVGFWRAVFAECTTQQGLIHDNRHLGIVYEKIDATGEGGAVRVERLAETTRARYERILRLLATGQRSGLSPEEQRVLALWGEKVSNAELRAAAERVRFQQGLADRFQDGLRRSGVWRGHILESLRRENVPDDLVALPHVESSYNPEARSFVGAAGLWQFTRDTGKRFMRIDQAVDERRDPYESSDAAAKLLKYNYSVLGSWPLAITAYNHGTAGMRRAAEQMGTKKIETIIRKYDGRAFGFASRNFYVSFLAALEIDQNPAKFFGSIAPQAPQPLELVEVPDYLHVATLERALGVSRDTLEAYNPSLLPPVWTGAKRVPRGFTLRLPAGTVIEPATALASIAPAQRHTAQVADRTYTVKRGDTLSRIAQRYGMTVSGIAMANGIKPGSRIRIGQTLKLPGVESAPVPAAVVVREAPPPVAAPTTAAVPPPRSYTVRAGDTLSRIAERTGVSQRDLLAWNGLANADRIRRGQTLTLVAPVAAAAVAAPEPARARRPAPAATEPPGLADSSEAGAVPSLADPSNYLVADDDTVEVQAAETMTHYAEWLEIKPEQIRVANDWKRQRELTLGQRVKLDFNRVSRDTFLSRRVAYHHDLQEEFFSRYRITTTTEHRLRRGESVWVLASQKYKVPVWLLRQYNPKLDFDRVRPGMRVVFPTVVRVASEPADAGSVASLR